MGIQDHGAPAEVKEAFVTDADPGPRMDLWSRNDPVTLFGAIGMAYTLGFERVNGAREPTRVPRGVERR